MLVTVLCAVGLIICVVILIALHRRPYICSVFPMGATPLVHMSDRGVVPYRMAWTILPTDDVLVQFALPNWSVETIEEAKLSSGTLFVRVDAVKLMRGVPAPHTAFKVGVPVAFDIKEVVVLPVKGKRGRRVPYVTMQVPAYQL